MKELKRLVLTNLDLHIGLPQNDLTHHFDYAVGSRHKRGCTSCKRFMLHYTIPKIENFCIASSIAIVRSIIKFKSLFPHVVIDVLFCTRSIITSAETNVNLTF